MLLSRLIQLVITVLRRSPKLLLAREKGKLLLQHKEGVLAKMVLLMIVFLRCCAVLEKRKKTLAFTGRFNGMEDEIGFFDL